MKKFFKYLLSVLLSLLFHWYWSIPAWVLLVLHFTLGISIWWFVAALLLWIVGVRLFMRLVGWLTYMGNKKEAENKNVNPYSKNNEKTTQTSERNKENDIREVHK